MRKTSKATARKTGQKEKGAGRPKRPLPQLAFSESMIVEAFRIGIRMAYHTHHYDVRRLKRLLERAFLEEADELGLAGKDLALLFRMNEKSVELWREQAQEKRENQVPSPIVGQVLAILGTHSDIERAELEVVLRENLLGASQPEHAVDNAVTDLPEALALLQDLDLIRISRAGRYRAVPTPFPVDDLVSQLSERERNHRTDLAVMTTIAPSKEGITQQELGETASVRVTLGDRSIGDVLKSLKERELIKEVGQDPQQPRYTLEKGDGVPRPTDPIERFRTGHLGLLSHVREYLDAVISSDPNAYKVQSNLMCGLRPDDLESMGTLLREYIETGLKKSVNSVGKDEACRDIVMLWAMAPLPEPPAPRD